MNSYKACCSIALAHAANRPASESPKLVAQSSETAEERVDLEAIIRKDHSGSRVLVVDDDVTGRVLLQMQLEDVGLAVDAANDGQSAVARASLAGYDAILMDLWMPGVDGLEATRQIRKISGYGTIPIIATTGDSSSEVKALCTAAGMDDFLAKPFSANALFSTVLRWLEQSQANDIRACANNLSERS
ncbi:MAG: response regulator [Sulfuritalea sp.]|nr:response regulator [Sulfuritalea sp.]